MYYPENFPKEKKNFLKKLFLYLCQAKPGSRKELGQKVKSFLKGKKIGNFYPSFWMINFVYWRFFSKKIKAPPFLKFIQKTKTRSLSGIVPLSIFTKPADSCPFSCLYCPTQEGVPKSYFPDEAALMRAIRNKYDPFLQTKSRLIQFFLSSHPIDKVEAIVQGGTFSSYPKNYREKFIQRIYDACNLDICSFVQEGKSFFKKSHSLSQAKKINEKAPQRVIGLTIETRPDFITPDEILFLRKLSVTRVEIGVQTLDEKVLRFVKRGHGVGKVARATKLLKEAGFKVTYHLMPGLPGSNLEKDIKVLRKVFEDEVFKPDYLKLYPTQVAWGSKLLKLYQKGKYQPLKEKELLFLIKKFKKEIVPPWVRIQRLVRDLTKNDVACSSFPSNFRQKIKKELKKEGIFCPCIRCREIKGGRLKGKVKIETISYSSACGKEFFLQAVDGKKRLLGFLRLRIPEFFLKRKAFFIKELNGAALVRDLHIYGLAAPLGKKGKVQHQGLGRKLLKRGEEIAKSFNAKKIAVISGVGARNYYRLLGYELLGEGEYMINTFLK